MATLTNKQIKVENPEYKIWLHKRLGKWVIDVTVNELKDEVAQRGQTAEIYNGSNYQHTVGVFWFLLDRPLLMLELATEQIEHKLDTAARRRREGMMDNEVARRGQLASCSHCGSYAVVPTTQADEETGLCEYRCEDCGEYFVDIAPPPAGQAGDNDPPHDAASVKARWGG